jgi:hypothetical protein
MLRRVALVRTDVSDERIASIIRVTRTGELWTTFAVTSNEVRCEVILSTLRLVVAVNVVASSPILVTLTMETMHSNETSVPTGARQRNIPEDGVVLMCNNFRNSLYSYTRSFLQRIFCYLEDRKKNRLMLLCRPGLSMCENRLIACLLSSSLRFDTFFVYRNVKTWKMWMWDARGRLSIHRAECAVRPYHEQGRRTPWRSSDGQSSASHRGGPRRT